MWEGPLRPDSSPHKGGSHIGASRSEAATVKLGPRAPPQRRESRRHRERVAGKCARLIDRAERGKQVHDFGAPAKGPDGEPAANDLAERGQVRANAKHLLGAPATHAETGHHFVEN